MSTSPEFIRGVNLRELDLGTSAGRELAFHRLKDDALRILNHLDMQGPQVVVDAHSNHFGNSAALYMDENGKWFIRSNQEDNNFETIGDGYPTFAEVINTFGKSRYPGHFSVSDDFAREGVELEFVESMSVKVYAF